MASASSDGYTKKVLLLWPNLKKKLILITNVITCMQFIELINYVFNNISKTDAFDIHIPAEFLNEILKSPIYSLIQVRRIYVYYQNSNDLIRTKGRHSSEAEKLQFRLESNLEKELTNAQMGLAVNSSQSIDREAVNSISTNAMQRIIAKQSDTSDRHVTMDKSAASASEHRVEEQDIEVFDQRFKCPCCKLAFHEPYQLACSHWQCKSCINALNTCATCSTVISKDQVRLDRYLLNEMRQVLKTCSICKWTGSLNLYQNHMSQNHSGDRHSCIFNATTSQNGYSQPNLNAIRSLNHSLLDSSRALGNRSLDIRVLVNTIFILNTHANLVQQNLEQLQQECIHLQNCIEAIHEQASSLMASIQINNNAIMTIIDTQNLLTQEILFVKEQIADKHPISFDGSFIWKISDFQEKLMDAKTDRQRSIDSPPFYSSPTGYKMCLRLYLNGDEYSRDTHISLYLVIMRNAYDAILHWPFKYRVIFSLINQSPSHDDLSNSFWPDVSSTCFERPRTNMNLAFGIGKFFPLSLLEKDYDQYVHKDTIFVKAVIDFISEKMDPSILYSLSTIANDEEHTGTIYINYNHLITMPRT